MNKMVVCALAATALVTGCGGGGGGGGGGSTFNCTSPANVSAPNIDVGDTPTALRALTHVWDTASVETLSYTMGKLWMTDVGRTITGSGQIACSGGGTATITDTDANHSLLQVGDVLTLSFNSCKPKPSSTLLNGSVSMEVTDVTGDPYQTNTASDLTLRMTYTNLQSAITAAACGTVNMAMATTGNGIYTGTISGTTYTVANTNTKRTLSGFTLNFTEPELDATTGWPQANRQVIFSGSGRVSSADSAQGSINGSVDFSTPSQFVGTYSNNLGQGALSQGQMLVVGDNGSSVKMTAVNSTTVDIDLGNDGSVDSPGVPWSSVLP
jgi:hypothetical protein